VSAVENKCSWCEQLYENRAAAMLLYGRALGLSHSEAEDVLQDTFLALIQLGQPPLNPEHFAVRTYRNRALNHRRSLLRRLRREAAAHGWFEGDDAASSVEAVAMDALGALPPKQREVVVLKVWHELTFDAIGSLVGASPNTVAARYRYALRKIRDALAQNAKETQDEQPRQCGSMASFLEAPWPLSGGQVAHLRPAK